MFCGKYFLFADCTVWITFPGKILPLTTLLESGCFKGDSLLIKCLKISLEGKNLRSLSLRHNICKIWKLEENPVSFYTSLLVFWSVNEQQQMYAFKSMQSSQIITMHMYLKYTEISVVKCKYTHENSPNVWMFDISLNQFVWSLYSKNKLKKKNTKICNRSKHTSLFRPL